MPRPGTLVAQALRWGLARYESAKGLRKQTNRSGCKLQQLHQWKVCECWCKVHNKIVVKSKEWNVFDAEQFWSEEGMVGGIVLLPFWLKWAKVVWFSHSHPPILIGEVRTGEIWISQGAEEADQQVRLQTAATPPMKSVRMLVQGSQQNCSNKNLGKLWKGPICRKKGPTGMKRFRSFVRSCCTGAVNEQMSRARHPKWD